MKQFQYFFLAIVVLTLSFSCDKEEEDDDDNNGTTTSTTSSTANSYYFTATINGKSVSINDGMAAYSLVSGASSSGGYSHFEEQFSYLMDNDENPKNSGGIKICKDFTVTEDGNYPSCAQIKGMFYQGTYPYSTGYTNGAKVVYFDENGKYWASDEGSKDQTGSAFSITEYTSVVGGGITTATFNCKLYDSEGNSVTLSNGKFKGLTTSCY